MSFQTGKMLKNIKQMILLINIGHCYDASHVTYLRIRDVTKYFKAQF